jgi:hypothetical protein
VIWRICASGYLKRESIHEGLISAWDTIATLNSGARLDRPGRTAGSSRPVFARQVACVTANPWPSDNGINTEPLRRVTLSEVGIAKSFRPGRKN